MKIGVLMYTYNRTDDARINMEIIRNLWNKNNLLKDVVIVHSFNGKKEWWPEKYLEDELLCLDNPGHFIGAELLLNEGVKRFTEKYPDIDYVITLASDTWCLAPEYIENIIINMQKDDKYLATCAWGTKEKDNMWQIGMALDFNIFNLKWATKYGLFPIRFSEFVEENSELFYYRNENIYLERVFALRFKQAIFKSIKLPSEQLITKISEAHVYHMKEREPIHLIKNIFFKKGSQYRKMYWPSIGLITYHEPEPKQKILKKLNINFGKNIKLLLDSNNLSYYNSGFTKTSFMKDKKSIDYTD